jgi:flagellar basal-body rod protein FlgC
MITAISTALSGLVAQTRRLDVSAGNTANMLSAGTLPAGSQSGAAAPHPPYQPLATVDTAVAGSGTRAATVPVQPGFVAAYQPQSPYADPQGLVAMPNVDPVVERVSQLSAQQSFAANLKTLQAAMAMTDALLKITV